MRGGGFGGSGGERVNVLDAERREVDVLAAKRDFERRVGSGHGACRIAPPRAPATVHFGGARIFAA